MRKHIFAAGLAAVLLLCGSCAGLTAQAYMSETDRVIALVNEERAANGLPPLYAVPVLNAAADVRAKELTGSFGHTRPDGRSSASVLDDYGVSYGWYGENIAGGQEAAYSVMDCWMNSTEGHRENILNTHFTAIGVGRARKSDGTPYWSQIFIEGSLPANAYLPEEVYLTGDLDDNGAIDSTDAADILTAAAAKGAGNPSGLTPEQETAADVDGDGTFDSTDASFILGYAAYTGAGGTEDFVTYLN